MRWLSRSVTIPPLMDGGLCNRSSSENLFHSTISLIVIDKPVYCSYIHWLSIQWFKNWQNYFLTSVDAHAVVGNIPERFYEYILPSFPKRSHLFQFNITARILTLIQSTYFIQVSLILNILCAFHAIFHSCTSVWPLQDSSRSVVITGCTSQQVASCSSFPFFLVCFSSFITKSDHIHILCN